MSTTCLNISLEPVENGRLAAVCGENSQHLRYLEEHTNVQVNHRGGDFLIEGEKGATEIAGRVLKRLYEVADNGEINNETIYQVIQGMNQDTNQDNGDLYSFATPRKTVAAKTANQSHYLNEIDQQTIVFGAGPAGTGKTYLAVASAVRELVLGSVSRIVLTRPVVEAGEHLGFLPGDIGQKVDPYVRPLYDALNELLGSEKVARLMEKNVIELAPLAYMRGRTLNDAFIILDEAQNTTIPQMKMFLTRVGFGSKAVVTGDLTQIDLPRGTHSGLKHAVDILDEVKGLSICHLTGADIVRHPLVQRIVNAYDKAEARSARQAQKDE